MNMMISVTDWIYLL